jgi:hypothetical protein
MRGRLTAEHLAALLLGLAVLLVHDVGYLLRQPYWTDEAWVAVTTRFPLAQLPATTSSTPVGWSALLRLCTVSGQQTGRLLMLAFAGAAVVTGYWFGRGIGWPRRDAAAAAGLLSAAAVLLVPAMLARNDLKQYTADACAALLVLALTSRLERAWSRPALAGLSAAVWGGMLFSDAVAFTGVAAFGALCLVQVCRRAWRRLFEAAVAAAVTAGAMAAVYEAFDARANVPGLVAYWNTYYLPLHEGLHAEVAFVTAHLHGLGPSFGLGPPWLGIPLFLAGLAAIFRLGRPATAVAVAALWPGMLAASALRKYPFGDQRTSTFLLAITAVVAAVGVAGLCCLVRRWLKGVIAVAAAAAAVAAFTFSAYPYVRSHTIPNEDVRGQARYVAAHAGPDDVIVVNLSSNWGFAYYWPKGQPARRPDPVVLQGYEAYFPGQPDIVVARNRNAAGVGAALAQALHLARRHSCTRIWLVRSHMGMAERESWRLALLRRKLRSVPARYGLSVIQAGSPRCR